MVLVTGAGNGLGRAIAARFAETGCKLVLWDIDEKGNQETKELCENLGAEVGLRPWRFEAAHYI